MIEAQPTTTVFQRGDPARAVSVVVPMYNYAKLVPETLDSVAAQSFTDLALIVVDDASTDNSCAVVLDWMERRSGSDLSLLLLSHHDNVKLARTRNSGIANARSQHCFFLDADNLLFPRCIERHVAALDAKPDHAGAYSLIEEFGSDSGIIGSNVFNRDTLKRGNYIDAMAMLRRQTLEDIGGYRDIEHGWEDYDLWLRLVEAGEKLVHIPQILSRYRNHDSSMLRVQTNVDENIRALWRNMQTLHPWLELEEPRPQLKQRNHANDHLRMSLMALKEQKRKHPSQALSVNPADRDYADRIMEKIAKSSASFFLPRDTRIVPDYTGPITGTPFDPFVTPDQRDRTREQVGKMLRLGISWINPEPGVHSTRDASGDLVRYPSVVSQNRPVRSIPDNFLIHTHAFYPDILGEMLGRLTDKARTARLILTTSTESNYAAVSKLIEREGFTKALVLLIENRGRDIGPFLDVVLDHAHETDVIGHVHTKKSPDLTESHGARWRAVMYESLLSQDAVDTFRDPKLGLLFPDSSRSVGWGRNKELCQLIADRFDTSLGDHPGPIPVGNMFFVRAKVASVMREATQGIAWPREPIPYDGTVLHAIERMWPKACHYAGFEWAAIYPKLE